MGSNFSYAGLSRVTLPADFDLGCGVVLRPTFAHLFSPFMMAFSPAEKGKPHPAPWRAASGGAGFDITAELCVPNDDKLPSGLTQKDTIVWIVALIRLAYFPYLTVPVISDCSFSEAATSVDEPKLKPFEVQQRFLMPAEEKKYVEMSLGELEWPRDTWAKSADLWVRNPKFKTALIAFDSCAVEGKTSASLLAIWGALEQLFSPSSAELKFRISSYLAAYLEPPGKSRLDLYRSTKKLYDERSLAAHTAAAFDISAFLGSFVLARNALIKIVNENRVPTQNDLEELLFGIPSNT